MPDDFVALPSIEFAPDGKGGLTIRINGEEFTPKEIIDDGSLWDGAPLGGGMEIATAIFGEEFAKILIEPALGYLISSEETVPDP